MSTLTSTSNLLGKKLLNSLFKASHDNTPASNNPLETSPLSASQTNASLQINQHVIMPENQRITDENSLLSNPKVLEATRDISIELMDKSQTTNSVQNPTKSSRDASFKLKEALKGDKNVSDVANSIDPPIVHTPTQSADNSIVKPLLLNVTDVLHSEFARAAPPSEVEVVSTMPTQPLSTPLGLRKLDIKLFNFNQQQQHTQLTAGQESLDLKVNPDLVDSAPSLSVEPNMIEVQPIPTSNNPNSEIYLVYTKAHLIRLRPADIECNRRMRDMYGRVIGRSGHYGAKYLQTTEFRNPKTSKREEKQSLKPAANEKLSQNWSRVDISEENKKTAITYKVATHETIEKPKVLSFEEQKRQVEEERLKYANMSRNKQSNQQESVGETGFGSYHHEADAIMLELQGETSQPSKQTAAPVKSNPPIVQSQPDEFAFLSSTMSPGFDLFLDPLDSALPIPGLSGSSSSTSRFHSIFKSTEISEKVDPVPPIINDNFLSSYLSTLDDFLQTSVPSSITPALGSLDSSNLSAIVPLSEPSVLYPTLPINLPVLDSVLSSNQDIEDKPWMTTSILNSLNSGDISTISSTSPPPPLAISSENVLSKLGFQSPTKQANEQTSNGSSQQSGPIFTSPQQSSQPVKKTTLQMSNQSRMQLLKLRNKTLTPNDPTSQTVPEAQPLSTSSVPEKTEEAPKKTGKPKYTRVDVKLLFK